jgi:streptogramin lyase
VSGPLASLASLVVIISAAAVVGGWHVVSAADTALVHEPDTRLPAATSVSIDVDGVPTDVEVSPAATWVSTSLGAIVRIDPRTNERVARIETGGSIVALRRGFGALWAVDVFGARLVRIDPWTNRVERTFPLDALPSGLAIGHGLVWVASQLESTVAGIDPVTGAVVKLARFGQGELWPGGLAVGPEGVWVITGGGDQVSIFDPRTMRFRHRLRVRGARTIVAVGRSAWVGLSARRTLARIQDGRLTRAATGVRASGYGPPLAAAQLVWLAVGGTVAAIDPATGAVVRRLPLDDVQVSSIAVGADLWLVDAGRRTVVRVALASSARITPQN